MERSSPEQWSSPSPLTMSGEIALLPRPPLSGFNYRRDPALMMDQEPIPPETITIQDACTAPTTGLRRPHCDVPHLHAANATSSSSGGGGGVPSIAIPYIALHNVGWKDSNFKGRKWVIIPMVAGFESTFIANTLQGLLCLPGCESVMMGKSAVTGSSGGGSRHDNGRPLGRDDGRSCGESGVVLQSSRSSSLAERQQQAQAHEADNEDDDDDDDDSERHSHAYSASPEGAEEHSLSSSVASEQVATEDRTDRLFSGEGGDAGKGAAAVQSGGAGDAPQELRGGIRSQWRTRVKTAASRTYTSYVMQHLGDANIQLRTPVPRDGLMSDSPVTDTQLDDAEELESLRGQSATVPRCLAPVTLPKESKGVSHMTGGNGSGKSRPPVSIFLASEAKDNKVGTSTGGTTSAAGAESPDCASLTTTIASAALPPGTASAAATTTVSPPEKAAVLMGLEEGHSSDDNNSPTPSSREEEEEEEEVWMSTEDTGAGQSGGASQHAAVTRMTNHQVAQDASRYTCFASNCVDNMPNYPLPQLQSEDLVDLAAFMVIRSSLQPDEATDLQLGTHVLGNPYHVRLLPPEQRAALMSRAARLMEAAVFLQV
ncbi:hypothetical protein LBRM_04_0710 [Leishmania braziliensis MHOM/BR/75/M2904]|uniref:Uncharacterized protein n=2 Tax=Leishmania braziliensis TaxID=5660 RepID=A4H3Y5_LEIBR|nr:hypothetical protein LBRM_04_0710 [Leishmania braziliensis MHOM/BR/75/M2904]KAI5689062.1 hypothetical protein MNV84_00482 [Leishmania braziliensis]CAM41548.1 hypothetical protein LBRM_04_0710 [Leishmania braziliensis MHOM/BR/75/M2904]SYZ62663.1 hypothetical_protein [Leishmania braziliensis MHOM/BR/75/M2904]